MNLSQYLAAAIRAGWSKRVANNRLIFRLLNIRLDVLTELLPLIELPTEHQIASFKRPTDRYRQA